MNISSNNWSLTIDLTGGRIHDLSYKGVKVFGTYKRIDGKQGNTHLCIPSFDKEGQEKYNLPFHGLVRNKEWICKSKTESSLTISCETDSSLTYPARLSIEQEFRLEEDFIHTIRVSHGAGEAVPLNIGCHYYWDTPEGWHEVQINGINMSESIKTNGYVGLKGTSTVTFPHATYKLVSNGFHSAVLWTSFNTDEVGKKQFSQDFCCIEPVVKWPRYFATKKSVLMKGETKEVSISLSAGERT